jgi:hypothetical protein
VTSAPVPKEEPAAPALEDIYGLAEDPLPPRSRAADPALANQGPASPEDEVKPIRPGAYKPMSEAKKKKIAKRADKIEKSKPYRSNAAFGVSFGTVLAIALFGWRIQRALTRAERMAYRADALASAPEEPAPLDPKAAAAEADQEVGEMIAKPGAGEAREWLDKDKRPNHAMFEMGNERARAMVEGFYERGAERVYVLEPDTLGPSVVSAMIGVQLPKDPALRKKCLEWEANYREGEEPTRDVGQKYLLITTD